MNSPTWICCQIGSREHYAVPRALYHNNALSYLITDAWVKPQSVISRLPHSLAQKLCERFHPDLNTASILSFTNSLVYLELSQRFQKTSSWEKVIARNHCFQQEALKALRKITPDLKAKPVLFTYSYAARDLLLYAKSQGWYTVLGQIDPGPMEEQIVLNESTKYANYRSTWEPAPPEYWSSWQEECALADRILVNSHWSSQALRAVGIPVAKLATVPLAYQPPQLAQTYSRHYPQSFSRDRPLRVLFLGQVIFRKGIVAVMEAAEMLKHQPIEFWIVGSGDITIPTSIQSLEKVLWIGSVPRSGTALYYQNADVFLFPTLSDGFGLTQLEAQAWKLPIIASDSCGEVVNDGVNGLRLSEVSGQTIVDSLLHCLHHPADLDRFAKQTVCDLNQFSLSQLETYLKSIYDVTI
jgi:glycosyltransferase involved in cell wall biosynthesis